MNAAYGQARAVDQDVRALRQAAQILDESVVARLDMGHRWRRHGCTSSRGRKCCATGANERSDLVGELEHGVGTLLGLHPGVGRAAATAVAASAGRYPNVAGACTPPVHGAGAPVLG